jgi:succinate dehydrogenase / fumarate reductase cytochrome b subunit
MIGALTLYQTSIGKKVVMAVTGVILYGYVILHMLGNLKIFTGATHFNDYAVWLREVGYPLFDHGTLLWIARVVVLGSVVIHAIVAYQVTRQDLRARPSGYAGRRNLASTYASRTMRWGGVILGLFLIYHLLHLTTGTLLAGHQGHEAAYQNVVLAFASPLATLVYVVAMVFLGLHLNHGIWSVAQTLGARTRENNAAWRALATVSAVVIAAGFACVPIAVLLGLVR